MTKVMHCHTFREKSTWRTLAWNLLPWFIWSMARITWTVNLMLLLLSSKAVTMRCSIKQEMLIAKFTGKHQFQSFFFSCNWSPATLLKKMIQVFSCKLCKIFLNAHFIEHLWTVACVRFLLMTFSYYGSQLYILFFLDLYLFNIFWQILMIFGVSCRFY